MLDSLSRFFASRPGIILTGCLIGVFAAFLQYFGNPPNMGVCVACFERDIAGSLGFHRLSVVQYIRPEIIGFILGSTVAALVFREFKARCGSAPIIRFFLGVFAMIGALAFLGCPWRAILRLAGGDLNAVLGLLGLVTGIAVGVQFFKKGYNLGRSYKALPLVGWIMPAAASGLLLLLIFRPKFSENGALFFSTSGPGSLHAPLCVSLGLAVVIGFLAQRTRFCTMGSFRDVFLMGDTHLLSGAGAMLAAAFAANVFLGQISFGFEGQPVAHSSHVWNFLGMALAGLAFALAGGCPGRQRFLSGEGDSDAGVFVLGMISGAGFAHNFALAGIPGKGLTAYGQGAVLLGLGVCVATGFFMRDRS